MSEDLTEILHDVLIVGGGPAGLSASLYSAREKVKTLNLEEGFYGGQIAITDSVENYPGIKKISGGEFGQRIQEQAESFGAQFENCTVESIENADGLIKTVKTDIGDFQALSVIVATGANPRMAGFEGEENFEGRGVSYCATCDAMLYQDKIVYVVGGGLSALEEAIFLTEFAKEVHLIVRKNEFRCPVSVQEKVKKHPKIKLHMLTRIKSVSGKFSIEEITLENTVTNETEVIRYAPGEVGIFVFVGYKPKTELLENLAEFDSMGAAIVDKDHMTKTDGIFAAGDICSKRLRQLVTAASDGAIAATAAARYATQLKDEHPELAK